MTRPKRRCYQPDQVRSAGVLEVRRLPDPLVLNLLPAGIGWLAALIGALPLTRSQLGADTEERQRHHQVHHHVRRELAVRPPRLLPGRGDRVIDRIPRHAASTPRETQSVSRPPATTPLSAIGRDHAGYLPEHHGRHTPKP